MARPWRLLPTEEAPGPYQMGLDEALLATAASGGPPTVRFYRWRGPWLSVGYGQPLAAERLAACGRARVGVVRRATGGRAVLHGADLTYALAAPEAALPAGLQASYALVVAAFASALAALGVPAEASGAGGGAPGRGVFDCFERPGAHEIGAAGRKLLGSAQRRWRGAVLQHGSLRLAPDPEAARAAAGLDDSPATSLAELGCRWGPEAVEEACREALVRALDASLEPGSLLAEERRSAAARRPLDPSSVASRSLPAGISRVSTGRR